MFIRWHKRQRSRSGKTDVHWGVALTEATRIDGKPRQRHVAYLGSFTEQGIESVHQRCRFWDLVNTRLHGLADRLTEEERNRIIGEIAIRVPVPMPAEHAQDDSDRANREIEDLLRSIQPPRTVTNDWVRVVKLFMEIKEHLGVDVAKALFMEVVAPTKRQQKLLQENFLWLAYKSLPGFEKLTLDKAAQQLYDEYKKDGRSVFGVSRDAIRKRLLREQRERCRLRDQAASYFYEEFKKNGRLKSLEAIRESLLRAEIKLAEGDPAAAELIKRFLAE